MSKALSKDEMLKTVWDTITEHGVDLDLDELTNALGAHAKELKKLYPTRAELLGELGSFGDRHFKISEQLYEQIKIKDPILRLDQFVRTWCTIVPKVLPVTKEMSRMRDLDPAINNAWLKPSYELRQAMGVLVQSIKTDGILDDGWTIDSAADYMWVIAAVQNWATFRLVVQWPEDKIAFSLSQTILKALTSPQTHITSD